MQILSNLSKLLILAVLSLLYTGHSEAAISKGSKNSVGTVSYQINPYTYEAGAVITGYDIDDGKGLVLRVQPMGTYSAFSEDLLFCGNPIDMLDGKRNPLVLTYKTVAHRSVRGVGCHELVKVNEIKLENIP